MIISWLDFFHVIGIIASLTFYFMGLSVFWVWVIKPFWVWIIKEAVGKLDDAE